MGKHKDLDVLYSYRLTYFGGTAPCDEDDLLTLAICKRDMRRVMGRRYCDPKENRTFWFAGLIGKGLISKLDAPGPIEYRVGDILYIAKLTGVETFDVYFSDNKQERNDKIYLPVRGKVKRNADAYCLNGKHFISKPDNEVHKEKWLQDRDWDIQHLEHPKYVLKSVQYAYIKPGDGINEDLKGRLAERQGHKHVEIDESLSKKLERLTETKDHGIEYRPLTSRNGCKHRCGVDKA